jgi:hypothetical protein
MMPAAVTSENEAENSQRSRLGAPPARRPSRRRAAPGVSQPWQLMVVLDLTVMNIALPSAQRAQHFSTVDRQ